MGVCTRSAECRNRRVWTRRRAHCCEGTPSPDGAGQYSLPRPAAAAAAVIASRASHVSAVQVSNRAPRRRCTKAAGPEGGDHRAAAREMSRSRRNAYRGGPRSSVARKPPALLGAFADRPAPRHRSAIDGDLDRPAGPGKRPHTVGQRRPPRFGTGGNRRGFHKVGDLAVGRDGEQSPQVLEIGIVLPVAAGTRAMTCHAAAGGGSNNRTEKPYGRETLRIRVWPHRADLMDPVRVDDLPHAGWWDAKRPPPRWGAVPSRNSPQSHRPRPRPSLILRPS